MPNKFTIVAPHYDDEFIGCNRLIEKYHSDIVNIIYFTDSSISRNFINKSVMLNILARQTESIKYIESISKDLAPLAFCLNIPDGLSRKECCEKSHSLMSEEEMDRVIQDTIISKCFDSVLVFPALDTNHVSHIWCHKICKIIAKKLSLSTIEYQCHELLIAKDQKIRNKDIESVQSDSYGNRTYQYFYKSGEKQKMFEKYFPSQVKDFSEQKMKLCNWERYYSEIEMNLE